MSALVQRPFERSATGRFARNAVLALTASIVALLVIASASALWAAYHAAIKEAGVATANLANVLEEHARRALRLSEVTVEGLAITLNEEIANGPLDLDRVGRMLINHKHIARDLLNLFVIGADGRVLIDAFGSRQPLDLSGRPYFALHRDSGRDGIVISEPANSVAGRGRVVVVSHRLFNPDGGFAGIVGAAVSADYFQEFYRSIDVGPNGVVILRTRLGAVVARHPAGDPASQGDTPPASLVVDAAAAGRTSGTGDYVNRSDGVRRVTSFRAVAGSSYIVSVGRAHVDFLAHWWGEVWRYLAFTLAMSAVAVAACRYLLRQMTAWDRMDAEKRAAELAAAEALRRSEAQEHQTRERLETILNLMPLGCIVSDAAMRMTYLNPAAERIFGLRFEEVKGLTPLETGFVVSDREAALARHERLRRGEVDSYTTKQDLTKDGRTITCEWTNTALIAPNGSFDGILAMVQDITERSQTEEALRQSAKMESLGQLTGGVAHDFNNLLTIIMANVELVELALGDHPEHAASLQAILAAAMRGAELTRQLLAFARRQSLEPKVVEINGLVGEMTRLLARTIGEDIEIALRTSDDAWPVLVDPTQLESALANLVVNARDAMPEGGKLVIETVNAPLDEIYAAQHVEVRAGDYVMLSVSDTGIGMTPDVVARAFEPFFTTKDVGKGTGLGMSMVFGFVKQSGGHVKIYSEVGIGTTIRLYLPRAAPDAASPASASADVVATARDGETILLVEDDASVREVVLRNLQRLGYLVLDAADGPSALAILDQSDRVDLLFTDMVMPGGMTGADLAARAREVRPGLKVLLTSGYTAPALANQMLQIDSASLLSKPYRIADLAREVRAAIDR